MGAWIVIAEGPGEGESIELGSGAVVVGRDEGVDLQLEEAGVSRRHAEIRLGPGGDLAVSDLGSANGTYVNAEPIEGERRLFDGDRIVVGGVTLEIQGGPESPTEAIAPGAIATERVEPPEGVRRARVEEQPVRDPEPPPPPRRDQPPPAARPGASTGAGGFNYAAVGAILLGPLSILLVVFGSGLAFYASLPIAVVGIALGSTGKRRADSGDSSGLRAVALAGQIFSVVGVVLAALVIALLLIFNQIVDAGADSLSGLIDEIRFEIDDVPLPEELLE
ncbi:MAG TPA: FHA domain-containing protein [Solirubrobacterales bacterium]|nr:FHA domain-containing protein [Solirubrobacterales bacterium]